MLQLIRVIDTNIYIYALAMKGDPAVTSVLQRGYKIGICAIRIGIYKKRKLRTAG